MHGEKTFHTIPGYEHGGTRGDTSPILISDIGLVSAIKKKKKKTSIGLHLKSPIEPSVWRLASAYIGVPNVQHAEPT